MSDHLDIALLMLSATSAKIHGKFDIEKLYDTLPALTGTGNTLFGMAWGLSELGHKVTVYCDTAKEVLGAPRLAGADVLPFEKIHSKEQQKHQVYISINEPDLLRIVPKSALRICHYLLNDWTGTQDGHGEFVDLWVLCSKTQQHRLRELTTPKRGLGDTHTVVVHLSHNPEFTWRETSYPRRPGSIIYCSSPDRGLHHLLDFFPEIKEKVPEANLKIFYRYEPWRDAVIKLKAPAMRPHRERAEAIERSLEKLGRNGENGVTMVGAISNRQMGIEMTVAQVMAYPCDPVLFTEGFSCSTVESLAAGCHVVISDADALPEIYGGVANIIPGKPSEHRERWIDTIVHILKGGDLNLLDVLEEGQFFALEHTRKSIASLWETLSIATLASSGKI